jgi:predicted SnoaL-like aldol condensation-catalyzing enzyme
LSEVTDNKAPFRRFMEEVANKKNLGVIEEAMATDFVEHEHLPPGTPSGRDAARFYFTQWRQGFPDGRAHIDMEIAEGEFVVCHETATLDASLQSGTKV